MNDNRRAQVRETADVANPVLHTDGDCRPGRIRTGQLHSPSIDSPIALASVLIVDDHAHEAAAITKIVQSTQGSAVVNVDVAQSADHAMKLLEENSYDLAIVDVCLTGSDPTEGHDLLQTLWLDYEEVFVIAITGRVVRFEEQNPILLHHPQATICYKSSDLFGIELPQQFSDGRSAFDRRLTSAIEMILTKSEASRQLHRPSGTFHNLTLDGPTLRSPTRSVQVTPKQAAILERLMRAAKANNRVLKEDLAEICRHDGLRRAEDPKRSVPSTISKVRKHLKKLGGHCDITYAGGGYGLVRAT